jgi:hypothetical protein
MSEIFHEVGTQKFSVDLSGAEPTLDSIDGVKIGDYAIDSNAGKVWICRQNINGRQEWEDLTVLLKRHVMSSKVKTFSMSADSLYPTNAVINFKFNEYITDIKAKVIDSYATEVDYVIGTSASDDDIAKFTVETSSSGEIDVMRGPLSFILDVKTDDYTLNITRSSTSASGKINVYVFYDVIDFSGLIDSTPWAGTLAINAGGDDGAAKNTIDTFDLTTVTGNAADKGDLAVSTKELASASNGAYVFYAGGRNASGAAIDHIRFIDATTDVGNSIDKGSLTRSRYQLTGSSNGSVAFWSSGTTGTLSSVIDFTQMSLSFTNASEKGEVTVARSGLSSAYNSEIAYLAGGDDGSKSTEIEELNMTTAAENSSSKSSLLVATAGMGGCSNEVTAFFGGGDVGAGIVTVTNNIDYIAITTGAASSFDKGTLTIARAFLSAASNGSDTSSEAFFVGGRDGAGLKSNVIDYIGFDLFPDSASDKGDLTVARDYLATGY